MRVIHKVGTNHYNYEVNTMEPRNGVIGWIGFFFILIYVSMMFLIVIGSHTLLKWLGCFNYRIGIDRAVKKEKKKNKD